MPDELFDELGVSGLLHSGGMVDANQPIRVLQGARGRAIFREMEHSDSIVGALLFAIDMLIRQVDWVVEIGEDENEDDREFIDTCLTDLDRPFKEIISEILSMLTYGWEFSELVYKVRRGPQPEDSDLASSIFNDGKVGWAKIAGRAQTSLLRWEFGEHGEILAMVQRASPDYREIRIPMSKGLLFRTTARWNNPEGRSILQNAYRSWYFKKHIENIQGIGIERDLAGMPVLYVPPEYLHSDASATKKSLLAEMKQMLKNIKVDEQEGIIIPRVYDEHGNLMFELLLLSTGGRRQFNTKDIISYYDSRIALVALADVILLGHERVGSFALADSKTVLLATALGAFLDVITDQFNRRAIPQLLTLNGRTVESPPKLVHGDIESVDLEKLGSFVQVLIGAGSEFDEELDNYLRQQAGLPLGKRGSEL